MSPKTDRVPRRRAAPVSCSDVRRALSAFLDGEASAGASAAVRAHLAGCRGCGLALARLAEVALADRDLFGPASPASVCVLRRRFSVVLERAGPAWRADLMALARAVLAHRLLESLGVRLRRLAPCSSERALLQRGRAVLQDLGAALERAGGADLAKLRDRLFADTRRAGYAELCRVLRLDPPEPPPLPRPGDAAARARAVRWARRALCRVAIALSP